MIALILGISLHQVVRNLPVYLFGLIPFSIGIVLMLMPFLSRRRPST